MTGPAAVANAAAPVACRRRRRRPAETDELWRRCRKTQSGSGGTIAPALPLSQRCRVQANSPTHTPQFLQGERGT